MPETDKHAAAQQAVDILHEISTILVRYFCHVDVTQRGSLLTHGVVTGL